MLVQVSRDSALPCNQSESAKITLKVFLEMMPAGIVSNTKTSKKAKPKKTSGGVLFLVGGFNQPLWKMMDFVSCKLGVLFHIIPNKWGKSWKIPWFQTTTQLLLVGQKVEEDQIRRQRRLKQHSIDVSGLIWEAGEQRSLSQASSPRICKIAGRFSSWGVPKDGEWTEWTQKNLWTNDVQSEPPRLPHVQNQGPPVHVLRCWQYPLRLGFPEAFLQIKNVSSAIWNQGHLHCCWSLEREFFQLFPRVVTPKTESCYTKNFPDISQLQRSHWLERPQNERLRCPRASASTMAPGSHDLPWKPFGETMGKPKTQKEHSIDEPLARRSHEDRRFPILYAEATLATPASTASGTQIVTTKQPNSDLTRDKTRGKNGTSWNNFAILW